MAKIVTGRKPNTANNVSHAKNRTKKTQNLNKQTKVIDGVRITLTNREWKTYNKTAQ